MSARRSRPWLPSGRGARRLGVRLGLALLVLGATPLSALAQSAAGGGGSTEPYASWLVRNLITLVILALSFYLVALVVWLGFEYRRVLAVPPELVRELGELAGRRRYDEALGRLAGNASFLARVLGAGLRRLPAGLPAAQRALELANEDVTLEMEHRITYLATVGTLGPMIGLLGTVYGMIQSFGVIATAGQSPEAGALAAGISTALIATLEGIGLSVPAIACYAFFRNRIARLSLEVAMTAEGLLDQFAPALRSPHPLAAGVVAHAPVTGQRPALPPG